MAAPKVAIPVSNEFLVEVVIVFALFLVAFAFGALAGLESGKNTIRKAAIEAGVARYTVDPRTGATRFEFTTPATQ